MKANFIKRLGAYILDVIFISIIVSLITMGISNEKYTKLNDEYTSIITSYSSGDITIDDYLSKSKDYTYEINKASIVSNSISLLMTIVYFVVFQFLNKGQTIGKKIFNIRVKEDEKNPGIKAMILRSFITMGILSGILDIIFVLTLNKNSYFTAYSIVSYGSYLFVIVSAIMILYRKDKRGLHDLMANTEVVSERG